MLWCILLIQVLIQCYWAMAGSNETHQWGPDAKLTPYGIHEGEQRADAWKKQILLGAPIPQKHFVSPLSRSIKTMEMTWKNIYGWLDGTAFPGVPREVRPVVKEVKHPFCKPCVQLHASYNARNIGHY